MEGLDPRKSTILRAVVIEYITDGEPIGSELIAQKYDLGVRSATVRNELAEMADLGYLEQPHTSAGRIPSDTGYRYYVDHLLTPKQPDTNSKRRIKDAAGKSEALRQLLQDTTKMLSRMTQQLSAAAIPGASKLAIRSAVVTALGPGRGLLVLVLSNGDVENKLIDLPPTATLEDFGRLNDLIPRQLVGLTMKAVTKLKTSLTGEPAFDGLLNSVYGAVKSIAKDLAQMQLVVEGEQYIVAQPELQRDTVLLKEVLAHLENEDIIGSVIVSTSAAKQSATIGKENLVEGFRSLSILRHSFFIGDEEAGTLAIIGPTRINYDDGFALLRCTAQAVSETLSKGL